MTPEQLAEIKTRVDAATGPREDQAANVMLALNAIVDMPALLAEVERLQVAVTERGEALAKYQQACGDHQRNTFAAREDTQAALAALASVEADRDRARDIAVALEQQLAEIKDYAYRGGQNGEIVRRWILGVFERDRRALNGGEG